MRTVAAEELAAQVASMPDVDEALAAFAEQQGNMVRMGRVLNDAALLEEKRQTVLAALKKQGIALESVPGKYDQSADESIEMLVQKYHEHLATLPQEHT